MKKCIYVDMNDLESVKKAEKKQTQLENAGYSYSKSTLTGFDKYKLEYIK